MDDSKNTKISEEKIFATNDDKATEEEPHIFNKEPINKEKEFIKKEEEVTKKEDEPAISPFLKPNNVQNIDEIDKSELKKEQSEYEKKTIKDKILFRENCKLYRRNSVSKAFELRGEGEILIVEDKETSLYKICMIRDQIKTFGCNHFIEPKSECVPVKKYKNAWIWFSLGDFCNTGRNDSAQQVFIVRFKNEVESKKFNEVFEEGRVVNGKSIKEEESK